MDGWIYIDGWMVGYMDGWVDGWDIWMDACILTIPNWTHCLHHGLHLQSLHPEPERWTKVRTSGHSFQAKLYSILPISPGNKKKKDLYNPQNNKNKSHSSFTKKGLPKVIPSIPLPLAVYQEQFLKHTLSNAKKPTNTCIQIRLSRRKGGVSLRLSYQLLHLAGGTEKLVIIGVAAAPGANSRPTEPSLWEMHQIKLDDQ